MADCDVNDIICQARVLASMENLRQAMSSETFQEKFPELEGMDEKLLVSIEEAQVTLSASLEDCKIEEEWLPDEVEYEPEEE